VRFHCLVFCSAVCSSAMFWGNDMTKNIASALAKAQMNMGTALKQSSNPHFKSKYADLSSVMDACLPALNEAGIAVIQPTGEDDHGRFVETILIHGESGEQLGCRVPLIVQKNDMQGYGSAVTYARRYGLMTMAGIAPEDDDGNAAAKSAPKAMDVEERRKKMDVLLGLMKKTNTQADGVCKHFRVETLHDLTDEQLEKAISMVSVKAQKMPEGTVE